MGEFTHFDERGAARMVDVSDKPVTEREAVARGAVFAAPETLAKIESRAFSKGDVLEVARLAGIMGAKRTSELIPLCHPLSISSVALELSVDHEAACVRIESRVRIAAQTGVEMEALTAVSVAALTVYDMCKSVDRGMVLSEIRLMRKSGGKSGEFVREDETS